jgi:hypothetical protein
VPLCKSSSSATGAFGWLSLCPGDGSTSGLKNELTAPCNPNIDVPTWIPSNSGASGQNQNQIMDTMNANFHGKTLLIPLFDGTCKTQPTSNGLADCTSSGQQVQYYHIPGFVAFLFDTAESKGTNCPGNGSSSCLTGWFVRYVTQGPVGQYGGGQIPASALGVQLVH